MSTVLLDWLEDIDDPRMSGKVKYNLSTILFAALCGILSNYESWGDIADYCEAKQGWLSQYVVFPNGMPSAWTFRRVFTILNPSHNEVTAIPLLLNSLDLTGKTVTIDAAGCQKSIAQKIYSQKGDYVLALKRNHPTLYDNVTKLYETKGGQGCHRLADPLDDSHGRSTRRRYFGFSAKDLPNIDEWPGAMSIVAVETMTSYDNDPKQQLHCEWRFYLY